MAYRYRAEASMKPKPIRRPTGFRLPTTNRNA